VIIAQGHDHVLTLPVSIGPLILRVALLATVPAIAAFTMLRGFVPEPRRTATAMVAVSAAAAILLELMLAADLDLPAQGVVLLLALAAAPPALLLTKDERTPIAGISRKAAPWIVAALAVAALVMFGRAWLADTVRPAALHAAVVLALTGLSWFTLCQPRRPIRAVWLLLWVEATVLAMAMLAGTAHAIVLQPLEP
jgi:hypothetical protein